MYCVKSKAYNEHHVDLTSNQICVPKKVIKLINQKQIIGM